MIATSTCAASRSTGDEEHHAIHHAEAQAQSERDEQRGGATAGAKIPRIQLYGRTRGSARHCAKGLGSFQEAAPGDPAARKRGPQPYNPHAPRPPPPHSPHSPPPPPN